MEPIEISEAEIVRRYREIRALRFVPRKFARSYVPRTRLKLAATLFARSTVWLLPWTVREYPGRHRGLVEALQGKRKRGTLLAYMWGKRRLPEEIALAMAGLIRARCNAGLALVAELEAYAARQSPERRRRREAGFMAVDAVTGLSGRVRVGKRRGVMGV